MRPFQRFARIQSSSGLLLVVATLVALLWSNSAQSESYAALWHTTVALTVGEVGLAKDLGHWINDGLMAVFFLVVGLEIKRELLVGELSSRRQAALPIAAALGGMLVPALLYQLLNGSGPGQRGWGVPMATDIAFALGVLALLGSRVPTRLKLFLTALAIADDLGATLVITLFYTSSLDGAALAAAAVVLLLLVGASWAGARHPLIYGGLGILLWLAFLQSGIHATVAGVVLAATVPVQARLDTRRFVDWSRQLLGAFEAGGDVGPHAATSQVQRTAVREIEQACEGVQTPLHRMEDVLHPWTSYLILPVFALANAGVSLAGTGSAARDPITLGIVLGLVLGKPVGILAFAWLAVRTGLAALPDGLTWRHVAGAACLGGIGFTMSLFVAGLAFGPGASLAAAKLGILSASAISALLGFLVLRTAPRAS